MNRARKRKALLRRLKIATLLILIAVLLAAGVFFYKKKIETEMQAGRYGSPGLENGVLEQEEPLFFTKDRISYGGKNYRRNTYVKAVLCMGVDRTGTMEEKTTTGFGGQADGIILIAHDTARNNLKLLMIPRDTMTPIILTDLSGNVLGKDTQHLTLAYAYGDGREKSCEYMAEAVSDLLGGIAIDHYLAADIDTISILNDFVGGVTVTVPSEGMEKANPAFVYGSTVTLRGEQAEKFVRYRDTGQDHSALYRMDRQQEYILRFADAVREQAKKDDGLVTRLFEEIQNYMVTDMEKAEYLKVAMSGLEAEGLASDGIYTLPGQGVSTAKYDEFYPDEEGMKQVVLELFYREEE